MGNSRMSPLSALGRYNRGMHHHRLSQDSFSGRSTPDNHSFVSLDGYGGEGLHSPDGPGDHDSVLDRLTPSEADSSYSRLPPSTVSGIPHSSRVWSYVQDHQIMASPRSPLSLPGAYPPSPPSGQTSRSLRPNPFSAPQLHPHEFHHRAGMNMLHPVATTPDAIPNGSALNDLDEELSSYHELGSSGSRHGQGYRRASLPVSSGVGMPGYGGSLATTPTPATTADGSNKKWDFKYQRSRRTYRGKGSGGNGQDGMGRMSPYTSSDMGRFTPTYPPYSNHLEDPLHLGAMPADPVKKANVVPPGTRSRKSSSQSPVKLSSPVPIEPSSHPHPYHHHPQSPHKPHPQHGSPIASESKILQTQDSYDDEDDPDNGAKAASGGSRSGSKMSSLGSKSDFDHEDRKTVTQASSTQHTRVGTGGGGERDNCCASPEPVLLGISSTASRSSLRLNLSSMQAPLPPYHEHNPHPHHHIHQHQQREHQSLASDQRLRSHSLHTTEDIEHSGKASLKSHSSGSPSSPVRFVTTSSSSLGQIQPDSHHSNNDNKISPTRDYEVPKLELVDDSSPTHPASELGSAMTEGNLTVEDGSSSPLRKKSNASMRSNISNIPQNDISRTGSTSSNVTHKGAPSATNGLESPQRTTQGALSESALKSVEALNGIKQSINKAITFEQQLKALAESGSSDQDSDSEPHASQGLTIPQHEQQKISDKMKTSVPPQQIVVRLTKAPTVSSFGFSVADGQYDQGVYVKAVKPGGPADGSDGLRPYDRILTVR